MKKSIFLLLSLVVLSFLSVKGQSKYCTSYADFIGNNWQKIDTAKINFISLLTEKDWVTPKTTSKYAKNTEAYLPVVSNKELSDKLWKDARFIQNGDSLYFNCRGVLFKGNTLGNCFVPVLNVCSDDNVLFVLSEHNQNIYKSKWGRILAVSVYVDFGLMGALFWNEGLNLSKIPVGKKPIYGKKTFCYMFNMPSEQVVRIDDLYMQKQLSSTPDLLEEYKSKDKHERITAESVMYYFGKLGMLD